MPSRPSTVITDATHGLAFLARRFGCIALADAPKDSVGNAESWAQANLRDRILGCFNYCEVAGSDIPPSGPIAGAIALKSGGPNGRAAGLQGTPVRGVDAINVQVAHTPRIAAGTDESKLVAAYLTPIVASPDGFVMVGGYLKNATDDVRRFANSQRVADHVVHLIEETGQRYLVDHSVAPPAEIADACERAARTLIPREIVGIDLAPNDERNTVAARTQGAVYLRGDLFLHGTNVSIEIEAAIQVAIPAGG